MAECKNCGAKWGSPQFSDLKPMKEIVLWAASKDGRYVVMERMSEPVTFWKIDNRLTTEDERKKALVAEPPEQIQPHQPSTGLHLRSLTSIPPYDWEIRERFGNIQFLADEEIILYLKADWCVAKVIGLADASVKTASRSKKSSPILTNKRLIFMDCFNMWSKGKIEAEIPLDHMESASSTGFKWPSRVEVRLKNGAHLLIFFFRVQQTEGGPDISIQGPVITSDWMATAINNAIARAKQHASHI